MIHSINNISNIITKNKEICIISKQFNYMILYRIPHTINIIIY